MQEVTEAGINCLNRTSLPSTERKGAGKIPATAPRSVSTGWASKKKSGAEQIAGQPLSKGTLKTGGGKSAREF